MDDLDRRRLWVGNLGERITEFNLLKILRRYGDIAQFDFLFHKTGPNQGKPRGYCFVSYKTKEEAEHAMDSLDGKMALSKKLFVKWAHSQQQGVDGAAGSSSTEESGMKAEKLPSSFGGHQAGQAGTSSNNKKSAAEQSTQAKIRAIESKLKQMGRSSGDFNVVPVYKQRTNSNSNKKLRDTYDNSRRKPYHKKR